MSDENGLNSVIAYLIPLDLSMRSSDFRRDKNYIIDRLRSFNVAFSIKDSQIQKLKEQLADAEKVIDIVLEYSPEFIDMEEIAEYKSKYKVCE